MTIGWELIITTMKVTVDGGSSYDDDNARARKLNAMSLDNTMVVGQMLMVPGRHRSK